MRNHLQFYIDGAWVAPSGDERMEVINPATEAVAGHIALGNAEDVDKAVMAARRAFGSWSLSTSGERIELLGTIAAEYQKRLADLAEAITEEMGAPSGLARSA